MTLIHAEASDTIDAPPGEVYAVLSDYQVGHAAILPKPYFTAMKVEQGGQGAGTVITVHMNVFGTKKVFHDVVSEPEPGRVLMEMDEQANAKTMFTVEPVDGGKQSRVTIALDIAASPGFTGLMERLFNPPISRRIFQKELRQLNDYVRSKRE